jgi:hypothetical protein
LAKANVVAVLLAFTGEFAYLHNISFDSDAYYTCPTGKSQRSDMAGPRYFLTTVHAPGTARRAYGLVGSALGLHYG